MSADETRESTAQSAAQSAETDQPRGHHLIVRRDDDFDPEYPYFKSEVVCLNLARCGGWQECLREHEVDGKSAADGPWEAGKGDPWDEQEEFTFHGEEHEWRYGHGWTVEFPGCVVAENDSVGDCAHDIGVEHGEGTFAVDDDWDDEYVSLIVIERVSSSPGQPPSGGDPS